MATHEGNAEALGLEPGTVITSYSDIKNGLSYGDPEVEPSSPTIAAMIAWMKKEGMIVVSKTQNPTRNRGTTITICNWHQHQDDDPEASPILDVAAKPEPEPKPKPKRRSTYTPSEQAVRCVTQWEKGRALPTNPDGSLMQSREAYAKVFDMLHKTEKLTWQQIGTIVIHATTLWDWQYIQSPAKLRKKGSPRSTYPGQYYWQTIWTASQSEKGKGQHAGEGGTWTPPQGFADRTK